VGKSTVVNHLLARGDAVQATREVRAHDDRGKHTTTSRGLFASRYGGLIIDTPGMRELQLADHADGVAAQFSEIEELAQRCRFSDCAHQSEPGCAVVAALADGSLDSGRWQNYLKLQAEVRFGLRKIDKAFAKAEKERWKKLGAEGRARMKAKRMT
jgi:ribosome biogenesis GTPase